MQTINPNENGYVSGNGLLISNQSCHSTHSSHSTHSTHSSHSSNTPDWKTYLQDTHHYIPPMDEHKTYIYSSNQRTELFSLRSKLNLFSFYSVSGKYEVNMLSCLTELVDTLSKIFVSNIPNQKVLNMVGYKLLVYLPDSIQPPFGFIRDELYSHEFLGGVLPKETMRLYIRSFQYNDQLGLHALPCNDFEYSIMSSFYKLNISNISNNTQTPASNTLNTLNTPNTMTFNSGTFGAYTTPFSVAPNQTNASNVFGTAPLNTNNTNVPNVPNTANVPNTSNAPNIGNGFGVTNPVINTGFGVQTSATTGFGTTNAFNIFSKK